MSAIIGYIIGGLFALAAAVYVQRSTVKTGERTKAASDAIESTRQKFEEVRVVGDAYTQAQLITTNTVNELREEVRRLREQVVALSEHLRREESTSSELDRKVQRLQRTADRLAEILEDNQIARPDWLGPSTTYPTGS